MRLIDADVCEEYLYEHLDDNALAGAMNAIEEMPTVEPEPKKGKWIVDGHHIQCNVCHVYMCDTDREGDSIPRSFCPNCGVKMEV